MSSASVGFQCPECVKEGRRNTRSATTVFGGGTTGERGTVTRVLIGLNVGIWLLTIVAGIVSGELSGSEIGNFIVSGGVTDLVAWGAAVPAELFTNGQQVVIADGIASGELWRLITAGFFHNGILHLALNMWALWLLGPYCERLLGRWRYVALYLLSGIGGATAEFLFRDPGSYAVGASGSIFGLMAALIFFFKAMNMELRPIVVLVLLNLSLGFFIPGVSVIGHLGGIAIGGLVGAIFAYAPRGPSRTQLQIAGLCLVALALVGVIAARIDYYGLWW